MHKQIVINSLKTLDAERATYFTAVVNRLEDDPRTSQYPNLVYLTLKDIMGLVPTYLKSSEFCEMLLAYVDTHEMAIQRMIFDPRYLADPSALMEVTKDLVDAVVTKTMERYENGEIDSGEPDIQKFTFPYRATDLIDDDDEAAMAEALAEDLRRQAAYTGPERRKNRR